MTGVGSPAGQHTVRRHNLRLVLAELAAGPGSRAELAQRTGLTKATVASLTDALIARGIVAEGSPAPDGPGRPSRALSFHPDGPVAIGIEINVDYTAVARLDLTGRLHGIDRVAIDNRAGSAESVLGQTARICRDSLADLDRPVLGVGCAVPAVVGTDQTVLRAPNLPRFNGVAVGELLAVLLGLPGIDTVAVENEANLGALARLQTGAGSDFVYVSGEIGVGAGLVVAGELFRGAHGFAGELGHVVVQADGPACGCGGRGCVEQYAGQEVLLRSAGRPDVDALLAAVNDGDPRARAAVERAGTALGVGLASLLNVVDLPIVVLGGLYARLFDAITPTLEAELGRRVLASANGAGSQLRRSALGPDAAVRGAAGLVVERALKDPTLLLA